MKKFKVKGRDSRMVGALDKMDGRTRFAFAQAGATGRAKRVMFPSRSAPKRKGKGGRVYRRDARGRFA